jgi:hypothetical protein
VHVSHTTSSDSDDNLCNIACTERGKMSNLHAKRNLCGSRLRVLREAQHLSHAQVLECIQKEYDVTLTPSDLEGIEAEERPIFDVELAVFARFFHVSLGYLIWGETPPSQT